MGVIQQPPISPTISDDRQSYENWQWYGDEKREGLDEQIQKIVIVGGGSAGWMTACYLGMITGYGGRHTYDNLGKIKSITLIESPDIKPIGVGEGTTPTVPKFVKQIELDPDKFNPTYKYGINYQGWYSDEKLDTSKLSHNNWFHPFEPLDVKPNDGGITKFLLGLRKKGSLGPFEELFWYKYLMNNEDLNEDTLIDQWREHLELSTEGFVPPIEQENKYFKYNYQPLDEHHNPLPFHGYHFDIGDYVKALKDHCLSSGQKYMHHVEDTVVGHNLNQDGSIKNVVLKDGTLVEGDLFIDCSGFNSVLFKKIYKEPFIDYSKYLPCNRALAFEVPGQTRKHTYTTARAMSNGWAWKIPSGQKTGYGYVYSDSFTDEDRVADELSKLTGYDIKDANSLSFQPGTYKQTWIKNCYAMGLSAGFYEPLEATSHMITYLQFTRLEGLISRLNNNINKRPPTELIDHHNEFMFKMYESFRNYLIPHYTMSNRGGDFWNYFKDLELEPRAQKLLSEWKTDTINFDVTLKETFNTFHLWSWIYMMLGYNNLPNGIRIDNIIHPLD